HHRRHLFLRSSKQFLTVKNRQIWRQTLAEFLKLMKG
ncbi:glycosyl transferase family 2, partial [Enterococcus faecalis]